jgi:D-alanine-D-alanine ligase-like ATP-grasp enzyme
MRICVLNSSYQRSSSEFKGHDPACDPSRYAPEHHVERAAIDKATAVAQVRELCRRGFDVFVNLCDGAWDEDRAGIEVVQTLERFGCAFTGADTGFYEPSRDVMKRVCRYMGVDTPGFVFAREPGDSARAVESLRFPMIVKHPSSYGSIGMTPDSRVTTVEALELQIWRNIDAFGGALVEEFIEGREFTVLVSEAPAGSSIPRTYAPVEVSFPPGETFKHFDLKWIDYQRITWSPVGDAVLGERLRDASARMFAGLRGTGYARCDLRMDGDGRLYMLEINPNCGVFYPEGEFGSADIILASDPDGHRGFLEQILAAALRRQARQRPRTEIRFDPRAGYGMVALQALREADLVDAGQERPAFLVTRAHVERTWSHALKRWFREYAWPLTDEVHVMWSDRAEDWKPIDHSCDPNTWLDGLDLVARRPIRAGETITMDYATFCGPDMEPFACRCGSPLCRGTITGADHLAPFVHERYGDHVSDFVRRARRACARDATTALGRGGCP